MTQTHDNPDGWDVLFISYKMKFAGGKEHAFTVKLDPETLALLRPPRENLPEWTRLKFHGCPNCPLDPARHEYCPVAAGLTELIAFLQVLTSYEQVEVVVETRERTYATHSTLQHVAGSLMGIYMVTCGCPILDRMRPMVETHLPFSTWQETVYRVVSMYLLAQYFRKKNGLTPNWDIHGLVGYYEQVQIVNSAFADRLRHVPTLDGDASLNAIALLSSLAAMATMSIQDDDLAHWEKILLAHWG
jgi:hypothetical protein